MKTKFYLIILCLILSFSGFTQEEGIPDLSAKITPPSPTAAALGKYGDIPVGLYTGTPNISVPLYDFQSKKLNIPISLSYHASGIKVDEVASNVGLGWSLNAGGIITRTVRGLPDDEANGFQNLPNNFATDINAQNQAMQGLLDPEPDQFFFNVGGYSGKLTYTWNGDIQIIPHQDISVEQTSATSWRLIDPEGVIYEFGGSGKYERTRSSSVDCEGLSGAPFNSYITSWYLSKIIHTDGDEIEFLYTSNAYMGYVTGMNETKYAHTSTSSFCNTCAQLPSDGLPVMCAQLSEVELGARLTKIQASTGSIDFIYSSDRDDLAGGYKLQKIEVRGQQFGMLREFDFNYDYFNSTGATAFNYGQYSTVWASQSNFYKRLKLLSVQEKSGGEAKPPYSFNYMDELGSDYALPPRLSYQQDFWGYANKNLANTSIPSNNSIPAFTNGADRSPDGERSKAGLLYKITYPTGGSTQLDYEAHDYGSLGEPNNIICNQSDQTLTTEAEILVDEPERTLIKSFTVNTPQFATVESKAWNTLIGGDFIGLAQITDMDGVVIFSAAISENLVENFLWLNEGTYLIELKELHLKEFAEIRVEWDEEVEDCNPVNVLNAQLAGGVRVQRVRKNDGTQETIQRYEYVLEENSNRSSGVLISGPVYFYNHLEYRQISPNCYRNTTCGTICTYLGATSASKAPLGTTQGSHIGYTHVNVYHGENGEAGLTSNTYSFAPDQGIQAYPFGPLTSYDWKRGHLLKQVDYKATGEEVRRVENQYNFIGNVEEFTAEASVGPFVINGSLIESFTLEDPTYATISAHVWKNYPPNPNFQGTAVIKDPNGNIFFTADVSSTPVDHWEYFPAGTYTIEVAVTNIYESASIEVVWEVESGILPLIQVTGYRVGYAVQNPVCHPSPTMVFPYDVIIPWVQLETSVETIDGVTKTTNYEYSGNGTIHTNLTAVSFNNSDGEIFRTETAYAHEMSNNCMISNHMIGIPLQVTQKKGNTIVGGHRIDYTNCRPRKIYELLLGGGELLRGEIGGYTSDGYPLNYTRMGFNPENYTWEDGLLVKKNFNDWEWNYSYYGNSRLLDTLTDIDGQFIKYKYDAFQRLEESRAREGNVVATIDYTLGGPNSITTTTNYSDAPTQTLMEEFDGLGRLIRRLHNGVVKKEIFYDNLDRVERQTYLPGNFTFYNYDDSPLDRVISELYPDGSSIQLDYGGVGNYYEHKRWDEKGNLTTTLTEIVGRPYQIIDALNGTLTYNYDIRNNIEAVSPPSGNPYIYKYDIRNRMSEKTIPGGGTQLFGYDDTNDLIEFSLDANGNRLDYEYDEYGREVIIRLAEDVDIAGGDLGGPGGTIISRTYGESDPNILLTGKLIEEEAVVMGSSYGTKSNYIYDDFGRVDYQYDEYPLGNGSSTDVIDFTRNHADWLTSEVRAHNGHESFDVGVVYDYDDFGRQIARFSGITGNNSEGLAFGFTYNDRDLMTSKKLGLSGIYQSLDKVAYDYTERGWMKHMNKVILKTSDVGLCENPTKPDPPVQVETIVTFQELLEHLCTQGDDVVINDLDPCVVGDCVEELNTFQLYIDRSSFLWELSGSGEVMDLPTYPYYLSNSASERAQLKSHIENWLTQRGYQFSQVNVSLAGQLGSLVEIKSTNFNLTDYEIGCHARMSISSSFPNIIELQTGDQVVDLPGYPYCNLNFSVPEQNRLISDLGNWLSSNGYYYEDIQIFAGSTIEFNITQTNITFTKIVGQNCCSFFGCSGGLQTSEGQTSGGQESCQSNLIKNFEEFIPCTPIITENDIKGETIENGNSTVIYEVHKNDGTTEWMYKENLQTVSGGFKLGTRVFVNSNLMKLKVEMPDESIVEMLADDFISMANSNPGPRPVGPGEDEPVSDECEFEPLGCSPQEIAQQQNSIDEIMEQMCNTPTEDYEFPLAISLVRLCDGSTAYIVGEENLNLIQGPYVVVDTLMLNDPGGVISILTINQERLFAMNFNYEPNGNISKLRWKVTNNTVKYYDTSYDPINRLTNASYGQEFMTEINGNPVISIDPNDAYRAFDFSYDPVGNIESLSRYGMVPEGNCFKIELIDQLTYTLDGSQHRLERVEDSAPAAYRSYGFKPGNDTRNNDHYTYDKNGNMITDTHKDLSIEYNFLNLPEQVSGSGTVQYTYDAQGRKWKKVGPEGTFEYIGGIVYKDEKVEAYYDPDGRVVANYTNGVTTLDGFRAEYWHIDHLGNTRLAFSDLNQDGTITYQDDPDTPGDEMEIMQENHYYPFGMNQDGPWYEIVVPENKKQYNGKELDTDLGLNWYHYGKRMYEPSIGRFTGVDPISEKFPHVSVYNYAENDPVSNIDLHGLQKLRFDGWMKARQQDVLNGTISQKQYFEELGDYGKGGLTGAALISPVDEALVAGKLLTKVPGVTNWLVKSGKALKQAGTKLKNSLKKAFGKKSGDDITDAAFDSFSNPSWLSKSEASDLRSASKSLGKQLSPETKKSFRELMGNSNNEKVLDSILGKKLDKVTQKVINRLNNELNRVNKELRLGTIDPEKADITRNRITQQLLILIK